MARQRRSSLPISAALHTSANATLLVLSLPLFFALLLPTAARASSSHSCPSFASPKAACGATTCGHYVFKGAFRSPSLAGYRLPAMTDGIRLGKTAAPADCCRQCRLHTQCAYWNFFAKTGQCFLYTSALCSEDDGSRGESSGVYYPKEAHSFVGGRCNSLSQVDHYAVAQSRSVDRFQAPLRPTSFCLVSDAQLHINMLLTGYTDNSSDAAAVAAVSSKQAATTAASPSGAAVVGSRVRTWIREIGMLWARDGVQHSIRLSARRGPQQERGDGFMGSIEVDGVTVPHLSLGDELNLFEGQGVIAFDAYEKVGPYDVDVYVVKIEGVVEAEVRLRAAHPLLQEPGDAEVHLNLDLVDVSYSPSIHGVLGQSYREESPDKALNYGVLASLMSSSPAGTVSGLEGHVADYYSSSTLAPDCKFSQFAYFRDAASTSEGGAAGLGLPEGAAGHDEMGVAAQTSKFRTFGVIDSGATAASARDL